MSQPAHLARFSPTILEVLRPILIRIGLPVHDPFAGAGDRLGALCDELHLPFTGTEIEPEFIVDPRVQTGDSRHRRTYPDIYAHPRYADPFCVVTSPVYPNGMTDHFQPKDGSVRKTYRQTLAAMLGEDRPLHEGNMGRYGPRQGHKSEQRHWMIAQDVASNWPRHVVLNVSDCIVDGQVYDVVLRWLKILKTLGYSIVDMQPVRTPRLRFGANRNLRVDHEMVIVVEQTWTRVDRCPPSTPPQL